MSDAGPKASDITPNLSSCWDEAARLAALHRYDVLDTPPEEAFDDFVKIAAEICKAPMALVSFVDEGRQWFKARLGFVPSQTPIEQSVCAHAILQADVFVVPDLAKDARFARNALVTEEPHLRFYGGAILQTPEGLPLGAMCVLDDKPRPEGLTEAQAQALKALARQVMAQLELRRALKGRAEALAEKDLLMQEVHHRVKNSLSAVQTLLQMQAELSTFPQAADQLRESAARVLAFSAMHEQLYRTGATAEVDISAYLGRLTEDQAASHCGAAGREVSFSGPTVPWPASEAPTLGLILVELLTNSFKYGLGRVATTLEPIEGGVMLRVEDEGQLPPGFDPRRSQGFGMSIVNGLLENGRRGTLMVDVSRPTTSLLVVLRTPTLA